MTKHTQLKLVQMFSLCRSRPGYSAMIAFATKERAKEAMIAVKGILKEDESLNLMKGQVKFPNGSRIVVDSPDCVRADSFHVVIIDELLDERMVAHLKTRERLM